jgi:hypothetical protein
MDAKIPESLALFLKHTVNLPHIPFKSKQFKRKSVHSLCWLLLVI